MKFFSLMISIIWSYFDFIFLDILLRFLGYFKDNCFYSLGLGLNE